jgi:hypothetical protein
MSRQVKLLVGAISVALCLGGVAIADSAKPKPRVVCARYFTDPHPRFKERPDRCIFYDGREGSVGAGSSTPTRHMHWQHWGQRRARGRGQYFITSGGWHPMKVRLSHPDRACDGGRIFRTARLKVRSGDGNTNRYTIKHMPRCGT